MAAGRRDITIVKGDDYAHVVTINERIAGVVTPINITGRTFTAVLKLTASQVVPTATFVCVVTNGPAGEVTITMANAVTSTLVTGCYVWSLKQNTGGIITTILEGKADVVLVS